MTFAIGVDVQVSCGCPYAVLDEGGVVVGQGWVEAPAALVRVVEAVARWSGSSPWPVAPR